MKLGLITINYDDFTSTGHKPWLHTATRPPVKESGKFRNMRIKTKYTGHQASLKCTTGELSRAEKDVEKAPIKIRKAEKRIETDYTICRRESPQLREDVKSEAT